MRDRWDIRALRIAHWVIVTVAVTAFVGMLLSTGAQVVFRKLAITVGFTEELARVLFLLSIFLGIAIAIHEKRHIVVDFLLNRMPNRVQGVLRVAFGLLIMALLVSLLRGAATMAVVTWESFMIAMSWMRTGYLFLAECVAILLMMVYIAEDIAENLRRLGGADEGGRAAPPPEEGGVS